MLNTRQIDANGGSLVETPYGPAALVPLAWLGPGQLALVCADSVIKRVGRKAQSGQVMQEAVKLTGACSFSHDTAGNALRRLKQYGAAAGAGFGVTIPRG